MAKIFIEPAVSAATTVSAFSKHGFGKVPITEILDALPGSVLAVRIGDMSGPEATLSARRIG